MKVPIAIPYLGQEEAEAAKQVVLSGWVTQGAKVEQFEKDYAEYCGAKYAVAVSNCTTALHLSLLDSGVKSGDEVICPSMSFIATANSIKYCNAEPIFAEVRSDYNLDLEDVKKKITSRTKAIILVHQIGLPANIDQFKELCIKENLALIEDAACAIGSDYKGARIGSHSDYVCFSLHPRKIITTGEGGVVTTNSESIYKRLKLLRQHGMSINDRVRHNSKDVIIESYDVLGYNYRMTDIQGAIGIEQLKKLPYILKRRRSIAEKYIESFKGIEGVILPTLHENKSHNFQSFSILLNEKCNVSRNVLMQKLLDVGIATRRGIMLSHFEKPYTELNVQLENSKFFSENSILIPIFPQMTDDQVDFVITSFKKAFSA